MPVYLRDSGNFLSVAARVGRYALLRGLVASEPLAFPAWGNPAGEIKVLFSSDRAGVGPLFA